MHLERYYTFEAVCIFINIGFRKKACQMLFILINILSGQSSRYTYNIMVTVIRISSISTLVIARGIGKNRMCNNNLLFLFSRFLRRLVYSFRYFLLINRETVNHFYLEHVNYGYGSGQGNTN